MSANTQSLLLVVVILSLLSVLPTSLPWWLAIPLIGALGHGWSPCCLLRRLRLRGWAIRRADDTALDQ